MVNSITKKFTALALAGFMMTSTSGCGNYLDPISYTYNVNKAGDLNGLSTLNDLKKYYVIEVADFEGEHRFYLTYILPLVIIFIMIMAYVTLLK